MLCERCHEREATVHVTNCVVEKDTDNATMSTHDYCEECARAADDLDVPPAISQGGWTDCGPPASDEPEK